MFLFDDYGFDTLGIFGKYRKVSKQNKHFLEVVRRPPLIYGKLLRPLVDNSSSYRSEVSFVISDIRALTICKFIIYNESFQSFPVLVLL